MIKNNIAIAPLPKYTNCGLMAIGSGLEFNLAGFDILNQPLANTNCDNQF